MLARTDSRARALVLLIVVTLLASAVGARLVFWQVIERDRLAEMALHQLAQQHSLPAERGEITDRNGELLATSVEVQSVYVTPPTIEDPGLASALLAAALDMPAADVRGRIDNDRSWVFLKRRVSAEVAERIRALDIRGVGLLPETKRVYPVAGAGSETTLAAQILGFVDNNGAASYGVEQAEDVMLAGVPGEITAQEDVAGRRIADSITLLKEPIDGRDLRLTIDMGVQHLLEQAILKTFELNRAAGATGIIMNVETGAILGMASFPAYDANKFATTDGELFANPAVARMYEPGSVMKAFTIAAALDAGAVTTSDTFEDDNNLQISGVRIQNADRRDHPYGHGPITPKDVLALSNNVGAAKVGLALGGDALYDAFRRFGFGTPTGIELTGEQRGVVWHPDEASGDLTTAQNSFGQGLSLTAVQLIAGYASFANGGNLVTPHVVEGWTDPDGTYHDVDQPPVERIMRPETAATMVDLLTNAIDDGIAQRASIPGYTVAGKTGTAQIAGPVQVENADGETVESWRYISGWVDSSFVGILPASDLKLATLILIHRPAGAGGPQMPQRPEWVYADLMPQVLDYLAVPPDRPAQPVAQP
ncbi:MAG TPA: penicillin-binding protein 2 [Candidatus Limnocylindrales bacterium]|nr:penicillin-binding protein 2 [Candidatus Limnocylindrales bacterium]